VTVTVTGTVGVMIADVVLFVSEVEVDKEEVEEVEEEEAEEEDGSDGTTDKKSRNN
jgi:hypothetical protein